MEKQMDFFKNKVAVVTGGSDGIGRALVELLLNSGAQVATCGRNTDKFNSLKEQFVGKPLLVVKADVSVEKDCEDLIAATVSQFGKIDLLINNAGISMRALVQDVEIQTIRQVMDINFYGTVYCTKFALPHILQQKGTVVGVSSIAGYRGLPGRSGYSASKFAVQGWLEALRTELIHSGVNVMWVCPGFTTSNIRNAALNAAAKPQGESPMDEGAMMSSDECAQHILKAVNKRKRTLVLTFTGKRTVFMNRFFAGLADKLTYNYFFKDGQLVK
jgi:short-subunit dehydrogenase